MVGEIGNGEMLVAVSYFILLLEAEWEQVGKRLHLTFLCTCMSGSIHRVSREIPISFSLSLSFSPSHFQFLFLSYLPHPISI